MRVLFLDIDGVLNAHEPLDPDAMCGRFHSDKVKLLNHVLRHTGAMIVLSSAWRYFVYRKEMTLAGIDWLLRSHGIIAGRLVGVTREDTMVPRNGTYNGDPKTWPMANERGQQIADWLADACGWMASGTGFVIGKNFVVRKYAVVDDLDLGISEAGHPFVQTDGTIGLTIKDAKRLIDVLNDTPP